MARVSTYHALAVVSGRIGPAAYLQDLVVQPLPPDEALLAGDGARDLEVQRVNSLLELPPAKSGHPRR